MNVIRFECRTCGERSTTNPPDCPRMSVHCDIWQDPPANTHPIPELLRELETLISYASGLEDECARLGNTAPKSPHNVTLNKARALIAKAKGE